MCLTTLAAVSAAAQSPLNGDTIRITHAPGRITVDGDLSDEGWRTATRVETWYEINPGDNTPPKVRNVGWLTYDDGALYAAFEFEDPNPRSLRAPYADRDDIGSGQYDYAGVLVDARNTGHTGVFFVVTPRNIQYDSVFDDSSGEDASPDFFWQSGTRITERGWTLEIRIPLSSLRYKNVGPQRWGITLYRNYPREYHYQFFSTKIPHGSNCFVCRENVLEGLERLPSGGHLVAAPYVSASEAAHPADGAGSRFVNEPVKPKAGADVKFTPNAETVMDFTVKPDFSQIERAGALMRIICRCAAIAVVLCAVAASAQEPTPPPTLASTVGRWWKMLGSDLVALAEAMPEDKWNFKPTTGEFKRRASPSPCSSSSK